MGNVGYLTKNAALIFLAMGLNVVIYFMMASPKEKLSETPKHWNDWSIEDQEWKEEVSPKREEPKAAPSESYEPPKTFHEAKLLAVKLQKPVFAVFTTEWCAACKLMHKTLADPASKSALSGFIVIEVDAEKDGDVQSLNIQSVPTTIIIRPDGQITKRHVGAMSVEQLKSWTK